MVLIRIFFFFFEREKERGGEQPRGVTEFRHL